jgi:hypothetical protein
VYGVGCGTVVGGSVINALAVKFEDLEGSQPVPLNRP